MLRILVIISLYVFAFVPNAYSASTTLALNFTPAVVVSTGVSCTAAYPSGQNAFTVPVAAGIKIATCTVAPSTWVGSIVLGGTDSSFFAVSGKDIVVGSAAITGARTYNVKVDSMP